MIDKLENYKGSPEEQYGKLTSNQAEKILSQASPDDRRVYNKSERILRWKQRPELQRAVEDILKNAKVGVRSPFLAYNKHFAFTAIGLHVDERAEN